VVATVVLVHGAWHGAWCWEHVVPLLDDAAVPSIAIDLPGHGASPDSLSDLGGDARALRAVLDGLDDAVVCGHSYGGAVVSEGAAGHPAVRHLAFIAAFPLAVGESCTNAAVGEVSPEAARTELGAALVSHDDATSTIDPERALGLFYDDCAADDAAKAIDRLDAQSWAELGGVATEAAWLHLPSTYAVCTEDHAVAPALQRALARRCERAVDWPTSHSPFLSRPELVADLLTHLASATAHSTSDYNSKNGVPHG
jgi:pimeloyl-ACP methyl ester carboxylesterase